MRNHRRSALLGSLAVVLALLSACTSNQPVSVTSLQPVPLPAYGIGDVYAFTDGSIETVVASDGKVVRWRGGDGSYVTSRDVLLPRLAWSNPTVQGERHYPDAAMLLFPLQAGKSVMFTASRTVRPASGGNPATTQESWRCGVAGAAPVDTPAGHFDTWRIDCTMVEQPAAPGGGLIQRSFYYAADIGFYVRREEKIGGAPQQVIDLTGYATSQPALPGTAQSLRVAGLQQALERNQSGQVDSWSDKASGDTGDIEPLRTVHSDQYSLCRRFAERIQVGGRVYHLEGTGCHASSGVWDILALSPSTNRSSWTRP